MFFRINLEKTWGGWEVEFEIKLKFGMSTIHSEEETNLNLDGCGFFFLFLFFLGGWGGGRRIVINGWPLYWKSSFLFYQGSCFHLFSTNLAYKCTVESLDYWIDFPKISSVNVTKSPVYCGFGQFTHGILIGKLHFFCNECCSYINGGVDFLCSCVFFSI